MAGEHDPQPTVLTFGHGTLGRDELTELLRTAGVERVVDVRRYPGSRRHPHVGSEAMAGWLPHAGIGYEWLAELGGRRTPSPEPTNAGIRNAQLRAYADHMGSDEFATGRQRLLRIAAGERVAVMCSETVWWRCHRRLLADHLVLLGDADVQHLFHDGRLQPHPPTPEARAVDGSVVYPAADG